MALTRQRFHFSRHLTNSIGARMCGSIQMACTCEMKLFNLETVRLVKIKLETCLRWFGLADSDPAGCCRGCDGCRSQKLYRSAPAHEVVALERYIIYQVLHQHGETE